MTQKLKILGPYTPEHEGPFCTRDGKPARVICRDRDKVGQPIIALVSDGECEGIYTYTDDGKYWEFHINDLDLMNAEEVPQPREFWMAFSNSGGRITCRSLEEAHQVFSPEHRKEVIHVREVLPGEGE